jgi:metallo-beta-lactamase class B
MARQPCR